MIVINGRFLSKPITGCERFAIELCRKLKLILGDNLHIIAPSNSIHQEICDGLDVKFIGKLKGLLWEQIELPLYLYKNKNPLLLNLVNTAPVFYSNKISTLHDIAYKRFPESFDWKFRLIYDLLIPLILKMSKHIFTVSEFSKQEIANFYHLNLDKISVIYNAVNSDFSPKMKNLSQNYLLAVSSISYRKNFHSLIKAFNKLQDKEIYLYIVGAANSSFANINLKQDLENQNIIFKGRVNDDELIELYSNAVAFVYPSLYEGFGIPPLEAQACGCPVACSNVASLPEVGRDSVLYFDPYNVDDITEKLEKLVSDNNLQSTLREKGYENIQRFSWEKSAYKVVEIINRLK